MSTNFVGGGVDYYEDAPHFANLNPRKQFRGFQIALFTLMPIQIPFTREMATLVYSCSILGRGLDYGEEVHWSVKNFSPGQGY